MDGRPRPAASSSTLRHAVSAEDRHRSIRNLGHLSTYWAPLPLGRRRRVCYGRFRGAHRRERRTSARAFNNLDRAHHAGANPRGFARMSATASGFRRPARNRKTRQPEASRSSLPVKRFEHFGDDAFGVELSFGVHGGWIVLIDEQVGQDHEAPGARRRAAVLRSCMTCEPKPPIAPSSRVILSCSWASLRIGRCRAAWQIWHRRRWWKTNLSSSSAAFRLPRGGRQGLRAPPRCLPEPCGPCRSSTAVRSAESALRGPRRADREG